MGTSEGTYTGLRENKRPLHATIMVQPKTRRWTMRNKYPVTRRLVIVRVKRTAAYWVVDECESVPVNADIRGAMDHRGVLVENRNFVVQVIGIDSRIVNIKYGIPTGSVFGPIVYTTHVNSYVNLVRNCRIYMYVDNACFVYSSRDNDQLQMKMHQDFNNLIKWCHGNGIPNHKLK
ncbi:unnamed protein product [Euphydryas editha]|uniref:Reverse transcriptase n=1 Tax=Euphydryas editha TaxID=104508 RepID=A0AAU9UCD5_EUPED|nr:unnamed protein product [Euphydryas editha]